MIVEPLPSKNDVDRAWDKVDAIVEAYVSGRLVDGQALADAWEHHKAMEAIGDGEQRPQAFSLLRDLLDALTEEDSE